MTERQFAEIVEETKGIVLSTIHRYLFQENKDAVDDVAQEVYLRAYRSLSQGKFRHDSKISTWLFIIARNESLRMNRKLDRNRNIFNKKKQYEYEQLDVEEDDMMERYLPELKKGIEKLPDKYKVVILELLKGKSLKKISLDLGMAEGTVKSRLYRARNRLRTLLALKEEK